MPVLLCPNCEAEMRQLKREGVELDVCSQCRGVWLDRGELEKLLGSARQAEQEWEGEHKYFQDKYRQDEYFRKHKHKKSGFHRFLEILD